MSSVFWDDDITRRNFHQYDSDNGWKGIVAPSWPTATSTLLLIANKAYFARFVPSRQMTITLLSFVTTNAATNDDACDVGLYSASFVRLGSAGATSGKLNATAGVQTVNLSTSVTLQPGQIYYAGFSCGAVGGTAATVAVAATSGTNVAGLFGTASGVIPMTFQLTAHPLPDPAVQAGAILSVPLLGVREA